MAQSHGDRPFSFHNLVKMLISRNSSTQPAHGDADLAEDVDEPPDSPILPATHGNADGIVFSPAPMLARSESLLTRAFKSSPEMSPTEPHPSLHDSAHSYRSYPHSNISGISTAELTSDGGLTSPSLCNTPSPPLPPQMMEKAAPMMGNKELAHKVKVVDTNETTVEANLGRKRCISFACGRKTYDEQTPPAQQQPSPPKDQPQPSPPKKDEPSEPTPEPPKRRSTLTFVCPGRESAIQRDRSPGRKAAFRTRCRGSPAPFARKSSPESTRFPKEVKAPTATGPKGVPTSGLGRFEESEATRFHEFASSVEEDDEWVTKAAEYTSKITLNDCMKKENAIRRLGEEAEEEAAAEDEEADELADDDSTVHDFSSDDGNESDNEEGFADSDESDDDLYEFWGPSIPLPESTAVPIEVIAPAMERRVSKMSNDSMTDDHQKWLPAPVQRIPGRRPSKTPIMRPGTPNLPDSTDFVCGTLDEDRPLEAAYKSCMEQRRMSKHIPIPQDIDPSFPTSDPEDNEDLEELPRDELEDEVTSNSFVTSNPFERGRGDGQARWSSPHHSPKRMVSPPPRRAGRISPKRLKSPPPPLRAQPDKETLAEDMPPLRSPQGLNISHLVQRRPLVRTKSLPRTPNPFFTSLEKSHWRHGIPPLTESPEREHSRTRVARGPVDIVEGLEKKRQKRKEKFWRQHCRKAAKEQKERRPIPGKGAERMKELGLEVAERCRAYGVGQDAQLVLSV